jgi:hypothetical protein
MLASARLTTLLTAESLHKRLVPRVKRGYRQLAHLEGLGDALLI